MDLNSSGEDIATKDHQHCKNTQQPLWPYEFLASHQMVSSSPITMSISPVAVALDLELSLAAPRNADKNKPNTFLIGPIPVT